MRRAGGRRLAQQLFIWFALIIFATGVLVSLVFKLLQPGPLPFATHLRQVSAFAADQFAQRWAHPAERDAFTAEVARAFDATVWLEDASGQELHRVGPERCHGSTQSIDITQGGRQLGRVRACFHGQRHFNFVTFLLVLGTAGLALWTGAALIAKRITRPLSLLVGTTREIGSGNLSARVRLGRYQGGELGVLAESVNDMAQRIERQMKDQRELLAAVSHEVRSPLARLRVCAEILRGDAPQASVLDAVEREIAELDTLIGKLLASSRLDFETLTKRPVIAKDLFTEVLARMQLSPALLDDESGGVEARVDATLIARALENLLENAARHAGGPTRCALRLIPAVTSAPRAESTSKGTPHAELVFEVQDRGDGFSSRALPHVFDAFYRDDQHLPDAASGSLGLGLALVRRIARAHGGDARAENLPDGGAKVAFSVRLD